MDAHLVADRLPPRRFARNDLARLSQASATALLLLLAFVVLLLLVRRLSGALAQPLGAGGLLAVSALLASWSAAIRLLDRRARSRALARRRAVLVGPSVLLLVAAVVISLPGSWLPALLFAWLVMIAEEICFWRHGWPRAQRTAPSSEQQSTPIAVSAPAADPATDFPDEDVSQQLIRRRDPDGCDTLTGWIRADFAAGERTALAHVAFCPPFAFVPECYAEQADGPPVAVKIAQLLPYGVRFDLKLECSAPHPQRVLIEFAVRQPHTQPGRASA